MPEPSAFPDHFSAHASAYAASRPRYPAALFDALAKASPRRARAWDVATGNGQAALDLAERFDAVVATDASAEQIAQAPPHPRITWKVEPAEHSSLDDHSVDLCTVAQALHWLDLPAFVSEVRRVVRPGGLLAAWCYGLLEVDPAVDGVIRAFYTDGIGPYWPPERRHIDTGYARLDLPFEPVELPPFAMTVSWDREGLLRYLSTWSAVRRHHLATGRDAIAELRPALRVHWPDGDVRRVRFPLTVRAGRVV